MPLLEPETLSYGHYACRSLDETLPVFTDLLASKVVQRGDSAAVSAADPGSRPGQAAGNMYPDGRRRDRELL